MTYRGFSSENLEKEYSPSSAVGGDISEFITQYIDQSAQARSDLKVLDNLKYGSTKTQVLDFFPCAVPGAPLHVFIHGGYWQQLSQRESAAMAGGVIEVGVNFATLNYTLAPDAHILDMVDECRMALVWLVKHAKELGFSQNEIILSGHSAGAHLAAMLLSDPDGQLANANVSISSIILISGIFDLEPIPQTSVNEPLQLSPDDVESLSPMFLHPRISAKTKVVVAESDTSEFKRQSADYFNHLKANGVDVDFEVVPGHHHFDIILRKETFQI
jgi:arylformamidase